MGRGRGKVFENELRSTFVDKYPTAYIERNHDRTVWGRPDLSLPSPPDLIVNLPHANYLIEAKAKGGKSMPFSYSGGGNTLSPHQQEYLVKYEAMSDRHHSFVAVNLYNNKKGRFNRAWLVPIGYWLEYMLLHPRKSISMDHLDQDLSANELIRLPGSRWQLPEWA